MYSSEVDKSYLEAEKEKFPLGKSFSFCLKDAETSPAKTVLGNLTVNNTSNNITNKTHNSDRENLDNKKPLRMEDVPFR